VKKGFGAEVEGALAVGSAGEFEGYKPLVVEIAKFFKSGVPPVAPEETLEILAFMEAAAQSRRDGGEPVSIESVMKRAEQSIANDALCFDMGAHSSPLREGFTRVSAQSLYSAQTGFGWRSPDGLCAHHHSYPREIQNNKNGRSAVPVIYTNEITCDGVVGRKPNAFLVDVPPGAYRVYLLAGLSAGSARDYHWFDAAVGADRAVVKIPGPYIFEKRELKTTVSKGPLAVVLLPATDWIVCALVVYPAARERQVREEILAPLEREIYFLPPDAAAKWKETKHVEPRPMPDFSAKDQARGYALFARHWSEAIYPNTAPRSSELDPVLSIFASLGEYEPVTVSIRPLTDLADVKLSAEDLHCGGRVIPAASIDVRWVRYMRVRPNYTRLDSYHIAPDVLEHRESSNLRANENQRFWITLRVPDDAAPGDYQGHLALQVAGREGAKIPLRLRVLPIRLEKNPEHIYGMYYLDPLADVLDGNSPEANAYFTRKAELERRDMAAHGMTTHLSHFGGLNRDPLGNWTLDAAKIERSIALSRKFGLAADHPWVFSLPVDFWYGKLVDKRGTGNHLSLIGGDVPQTFFDEITKMVEAVQKEREKHDWPEFLYYPIDEPSWNPAAVRFLVGALKAVKRAPGARTYVTADPSREEFAPIWPYVDVWCCQPFVFGQEKIERLGREKGVEFWCYPNHICGENDHPPVRGARMTWGFGFWKSGFKAVIPWIYQYSSGDPWNYLDGPRMDFLNRSTPDGEPIPVALWEAYREGIDDGRYLYTLQRHIERAKKAGGRLAELARQAEEDIRRLGTSIEVQEKYQYDKLWSGPDFDAHRRQLASWILQLRKKEI